MYDADNERQNLYNEQLTVQIRQIEKSLEPIETANKLLELGEKGIAERGAPINYNRVRRATAFLSKVDEREVEKIKARKTELEAHIATNQAKIASNEAHIAEIKAQVREIMGTVAGGRRRTRANKKGRRGTRKHR